MANDLYRGYEIEPHASGGFFWTDERGFDHFGSNEQDATPRDARTDGYPTADKAMDAIDAYRRAQRAA
jgi:hypothetical protein